MKKLIFAALCLWLSLHTQAALAQNQEINPAVGIDSSQVYFIISKENGQDIIAKILRQDARELEIVTKDGRTIILLNTLLLISKLWMPGMSKKTETIWMKTRIEVVT